jgi:hypothetical protein
LRNILRRLDAAADGHDQRSLRQINGGLCFLEQIERLGPNLLGDQLHGHGVYRSFARGMCGDQVGAKGASLKRCKPWRCALERHVRSRLALKHLPHENEFAAFVAVTDAVADHALAEHGGKFRGEIAHLIGVRKQHQVRFRGVDDLLERNAIAVRV